MNKIIPNTSNTLQPLLFQGSNDNHFSLALARGMSLAIKYPQILKLIEADQHAHAIQKKKIRKLDQEWLRSKGAADIFTDGQTEAYSETILLAAGRKRMPAQLLFMFLLVRGYLGSIKDKKSYSFIKESKYIEALLADNGIYKVPGASTILENLNCLSESTLRAIHRLTLKEALVLGANDFRKLYFDSTRIFADSAWPTESRTIADLLTRIRSGFDILRDYGINVNLPFDTDDLLRSIQSHKVSIALHAGKRDSKKHIKKMYRKILTACKKLMDIFEKAAKRALSKIGNILPSIKEGLEGLVESIEVDIHNVRLCAENARLRVMKGKKVGANQKVLGIADPDAEIIPKGTKPLVFGYKPQIGRSEKGFIVGVLVPNGSASDAEQMRPITDASIDNATVKPDVISYDDGYTNSKARNEYLDAGVKVVSFSGAKGKARAKDEWDLPEYEEARNKRSMAESTMSIIKGFFNLGRFTRRGRDRVTGELLTGSIFQGVNLLQRLTG